MLWGIEMNKIFYSASTSGFYFENDRESYEAAGSWPDDAVEISQQKYTAMMVGQAAGKEIIADEQGHPMLITPEVDYVASAEKQKANLISNASTAISPLQDAVDLGIATDEEVTQLNAWKTYRVEVNRVDTSTAPDIEWPTPPL